MRLLPVPIIALTFIAPLTPASATTYTFTTLNVPNTPVSGFVNNVAYGINDAGQIVGTTSNGLNPVAQGFVFDQTNGTYTLLNDPVATAGTYATGINTSGQIVGTALIANNPSAEIYLRDPATGAFTGLNSPAANATPTGINDADQIVGHYSISHVTTGFLRDPVTGIYQIFNNFVPEGINNAEQVVGGDTLLDLTTGVYTNLMYPGSVGTSASDINNSGQIVGSYNYYATPTSNFQSSTSFVLDEATDTYSSLSYPGAIQTEALGINDAGDIVGLYVDSNYSYQAFLATPQASASVPEPTSMAVLAGGMLALCCARRRWAICSPWLMHAVVVSPCAPGAPLQFADGGPHPRFRRDANGVRAVAESC